MLWWHFQVVLQLREITCEGYCVGVQRHIAGDGHQKQLLVSEVSEKDCQCQRPCLWHDVGQGSDFDVAQMQVEHFMKSQTVRQPACLLNEQPHHYV